MKRASCVAIQIESRLYKLFTKDIKRVHHFGVKKSPKIPKYEVLTNEENEERCEESRHEEGVGEQNH